MLKGGNVAKLRGTVPFSNENHVSVRNISFKNLRETGIFIVLRVLIFIISQMAKNIKHKWTPPLVNSNCAIVRKITPSLFNLFMF